MKTLISFFLLLFLFGCKGPKNNESGDLIEHSVNQIECALHIIQTTRTEDRILPRTVENGKLKLVSPKDWTSGFFPGNLWMMYELTDDPKWKERALEFTLPLASEQWNGSDHDIGFKMFCSFGKAIKYYENSEYKDILIQSAKTLSTRYSPVVACIRSWDSNPKTDHWKYPVIIDNMMNLELLMWAATETGNDNYRQIAINHATTTMNNHFRDDYSCYHVVDYDPLTGKVIQKNTHQGFDDESSWARGQAWALYGFTMMYRETGMEEFLAQAEHVADYILTQEGIQEGKIPVWDFAVSAIPNEPLDASAGAVISAALFELAGFSENNKQYLYVAKNLLAMLSTNNFLAPVSENGGFLLKHSTGSKPHKSEIDVPLVYADYYFLESIIKNKKYEENLIIANSQKQVNQ